MEFSGLIARYRADRLLTAQERGHKLGQKQRLNVEPHYQLSVIALNSTYLDSVDKWYAWKGLITAVMLIVIGMCVALYSGFLHVAFTRIPDSRGHNDDSFVLIIAAVMMSPVLAMATWVLRKESFAYTHYPIRFNRKTRLVHVFRTNGTVLSIPWDKVFFTLGHMAQWNEWEVRGHALAPDNETVQETFAFSYVDSLSAMDVDPECMHFSAHDYVRAHWEFIRRYMEDGPQAVSSQVQFCMPVDVRRESVRVSVERVFANIAGAPFLLYWILFPFCLVVSLFRLIAMRTSKIPQWPKEIEAACAIEAGDPYAIQGARNGDREAVFPEAARAAGVGFYAPQRAISDMGEQTRASSGGGHGNRKTAKAATKRKER
jgi:hypothetical protein